MTAMDEYIKREEAIAWFMPYVHAGESIEADVVISDLKGMKAADVEPVKRGRWLPQILNGTQIWDCSECKTIGSPAWKRCPVCEAKMDEEVDHAQK